MTPDEQAKQELEKIIDELLAKWNSELDYTLNELALKYDVLVDVECELVIEMKGEIIDYEGESDG